MEDGVTPGVDGVQLGPSVQQLVHHLQVEGQGRHGQGQLAHQDGGVEAGTHGLSASPESC